MDPYNRVYWRVMTHILLQWLFVVINLAEGCFQTLIVEYLSYSCLTLFDLPRKWLFDLPGSWNCCWWLSSLLWIATMVYSLCLGTVTFFDKKWTEYAGLFIQVKTVLPDAVQEIGDVHLSNGETVENLLVVNKVRQILSTSCLLHICVQYLFNLQ